MAERGMQFLTGGEFAAILLQGHTQRAHIDEPLCEGADCASLRLLREHPDDWQTMTAADVEVWLVAGRPSELGESHDA